MLEKNPSLKYGLYLVVIQLIVTVSSYAILGLESTSSSILGYFAFGLYLYFIYKAISETRAIHEGYISFGNAFKTGMTVSALSVAASAVTQLILLTVFFPTMLEEMKNEVLLTLDKAGVTDEMYETFVEVYSILFTPMGNFLSTLVGGLFFALLVNLIFAVAMKKTKPEFDY